MRAYLIVALLLLAIFGSIAGYLYQQFSTLANADYSVPPVTVAAATSRMETWPSLLEAVGTIRARRGVQLSTETSGEIIAIEVKSGEQVSAGQSLLTLNDSVEIASRRRQQANLELARQLYKRDASLIKQKSIPQSQYDRSKADLDSAIAQLAETEARLDNKRIEAPFDGTVGIIRARVGDYIEPGTSLTTLQDLSELEVDFAVPAKNFPNLHRGLKISLSTAAFPERTFEAILQAMDSSADPGTRNLLLRATIAESDGLLPGMFARLVIDLNQPVKVVTVPETAVTYSLHGNTIFVIKKQADDVLVVEPIVVTTGGTRDGRLAISSGLNEGASVVTAGQNKLYQGARIVLENSRAARP